MGLDTSHGCWHGAYSAFHTWRTKIAELSGLPPLMLMEGFYEKAPPSFYKIPYGWEIGLPISWDCLKPNAPLYSFLYHPDCEGELPWEDCEAIATELEKLLPKFSELPDQGGHIGNWKDKTQKFIDGLRLAASKKENVEFM